LIEPNDNYRTIEAWIKTKPPLEELIETLELEKCSIVPRRSVLLRLNNKIISVQRAAVLRGINRALVN
jgi:hypothetical protein